MRKKRHFFNKNAPAVMTSEKLSKKVIVVYCLEERLNINQINCLKKCLLPFTEQSEIHLILDVSRVCIMDCAMVGFLLTLHRKLQQKGSLLSLANLNRFMLYEISLRGSTNCDVIREKRKKAPLQVKNPYYQTPDEEV